MAPDTSRRDHAVILVHGIRTRAEWAERIAAALEKEDGRIRVVPIRYGFFDVIRFLLPIRWIHRQPTQRVTRLIRDETIKEQTKRISVIAHSYGTYIISRLLATEPDIYFHRLIFCGSIVPDNFQWELYRHRIAPKDQPDGQVINDCGSKDIWPVLAQSVTWGYGSSGRFGFGHPRVKDRFHDARHGDFFTTEFANRYWLPFLSKGKVESGETERSSTPWIVSVITVIKLRYIIVACLILGIPSAIRSMPPSVLRPPLKIPIPKQTPNQRGQPS